MTSRPTTPGATTPGGNGLAHYQLGDSLGKGAFAQVFRALNWMTGETVAVKQIQLSTIAKGDLGEIMSEIDLLKKLNHSNIVQYKGFVKTKDYLNIILEYCENGSLHNICKRFGKFPENLVAVYVSQVLDGLVYLHDQGVIHRDIKGANILTNKDGTVKLADFGVATAQVSDGAVVGSPYWMAPEVIEQLGATPASDVWSVGCVVIELLEGKPPYHFLDPMPALFRIVQDDCPPIPEGASPIVKDFLYHCFQKDYNLRISAKKLLKHPWMVSAKKQLEEQRKPATGRPLSNYNYAETIQRVQAWNEALKSPPRPTTTRNILPPQASSPTPSPPSSPPLVRKLNTASLVKPTQTTMTAVSLKSVAPAPVVPLRFPEEQTDNWDDDFEEDIPVMKLHGLDKPGFDEEKAEDINSQTIRPSKSPSKPPVPLPKAPANMSAIIEDYSDVLEEKEEDLDWRLQYFQARHPSRRGLIWPLDIHTVGSMGGPLTASPGPQTAPLPSLSPVPSPPSTISRRSPLSPTPIRRPSSATPPGTYSRSGSLATIGTGSMGRADARRAASTSELERYTEDEEEGYDDIFGKVGASASDQPMETLQLQTRLSNRSWRDEDTDEEDPFADIEEEFAEEDLDANLQRDKHARLSATVNLLIEELVPNAPDYALRDTCDQLIVVMGDAPEMQQQLVSSHGMLAILEVLEAKPSRDVIIRLLKIVNLLVTSELGVLESFCLIGGITVLTEFTSKKYSSDCRLEASNVIQLLCHTSVLTLQMFISCRGLKILVEILDEDYIENASLVSHALNSITSVFELQSPTPKNDFCRMFIREGLLDPLSSALINVTNGKGCDTAGEMKTKIMQIILIFSQVSQSDVYVRNAIGTRKVIRRFLRGCEILEPEYLVALLKAIKHLSMSQSLLDTLQNANAIEILIGILEKHDSSSQHYTQESSNHILQTCYNLCRLNKGRQEEAAQAGIIPCLKRVIEANSPLKQFALPILCDLASAGKSCRTMLWQHDGLHIYLGLLSDPYFQISALEAIVQWLQDDTARVEDVLTEPWSLDRLVECFTSSKTNSFENVLEPLIKIIRLCPTSVGVGCGREEFFTRLVDRLTHTKHKPVVRLNLLRILRAICDVHPDKTTLVRRFGLYGVVEKRSQSDNAVLVRELARDILPILGSSRHATGLGNSTSMRSERSFSDVEGRRDASSMRRIRPALQRSDNLSGSDTPRPNHSRLSVTTLARKRTNRRAASEASAIAFMPPNMSSDSVLNSSSSGLVKKVRPAGARRPPSTLSGLTPSSPDVYKSGSIRRHTPE